MYFRVVIYPERAKPGNFLTRICETPARRKGTVTYAFGDTDRERIHDSAGPQIYCQFSSVSSFPRSQLVSVHHQREMRHSSTPGIRLVTRKTSVAFCTFDRLTARARPERPPGIAGCQVHRRKASSQCVFRSSTRRKCCDSDCTVPE